MIDKKKLMSDLEGLTFDDWHMYHSDTEVQGIAIDALELLKEQEPVKPVVNVDEWVCGCCGLSVEQQRIFHPNAIFHDFFEYCPHCGKKVDWEAVNQG